MSDDVFVPEEYGLYTLYVLGEFYAPEQAGVAFVRQVYLAGVTGDDELGVASHTGQEHLQLSKVGVLCFIQNDACPVQSAASHVCERCDLYCAVSHELLKPFCRNHVSECVV